MLQQRSIASRTLKPLVLLAGVGLLAPVGCGSRNWITGADRPVPVVPEDFVGEPSEDLAVSTKPVDAGADQTATLDHAENQPAATGQNSAALPVDAMVGHVNGEAIYARQILEPIEPQLAAIGRREDGETFMREAITLIEGRLREVLINKLILGEADRDLNNNDRMRLDAAVQAERDELLRFYGQGSLAAAEANFQADMGITLSEHLRSFRDTLSIRRFLEKQIRPKIVVNSRDVDRYYHDHRDEFNRPAARTIRLIIAADAASVSTTAEKLSAGTAFHTVAADATLNRYNAAGGGMFNGGEPITGDTIVNIAPVNEAILKLQEGEYAGPITAADRTYFVQLVTFQPPVSQSLRDVQIEIERQLYLSQFEHHSRQFRQSVFERGSYTDPMQMIQKLVEIAQARFDRGS